MRYELRSGAPARRDAVRPAVLGDLDRLGRAGGDARSAHGQRVLDDPARREQGRQGRHARCRRSARPSTGRRTSSTRSARSPARISTSPRTTTRSWSALPTTRKIELFRAGLPADQIRGPLAMTLSGGGRPWLTPTLDALQRRLGHRFRKPRCFCRALTHRSFGADHNERLEFLGDAVLSLAMSSLLFERFSGSDEGDLTRVRAHLVREDSLHRVALSLGLPSAAPVRGRGARRRCAAPVHPGRCAGGDDRRRLPRRRLRAGARRWCTGCSARSSQHRACAAGQGRQDRAAGMAAGATHAGADLPHRRDTRPGARADIRGRLQRSRARSLTATRRRPLAPRRRAGGGPPHARLRSRHPSGPAGGSPLQP